MHRHRAGPLYAYSAWVRKALSTEPGCGRARSRHHASSALSRPRCAYSVDDAERRLRANGRPGHRLGPGSPVRRPALRVV